MCVCACVLMVSVFKPHLEGFVLDHPLGHTLVVVQVEGAQCLGRDDAVDGADSDDDGYEGEEGC